MPPLIDLLVVGLILALFATAGLAVLGLEQLATLER